MKIIADDGPIPEVIEKMLAPISERDVVVAFLERKTRTAARHELPGLDDALACAPSGTPVIMLGWLSPLTNADDPRWHAALGYPNVAFRRLPEGIKGIAAAFEEAAGRKRRPDPLAIALLTAETAAREIGILRHDLDSAERSAERMASWLLRARKQLGDKTQDELIEAVKRSREGESKTGQFAGQIFPDVCVDVENTLFTDSGAFRKDILEMSERLAMPDGRPITIWSGGNLEIARQPLRKEGVPYKLVSKHLFRGASVASVVDDMPADEFSDTYGITYGSYHQV